MMSVDDAVERFSDAHDGELSGEEQAAFDALLADNEAVRTEYEEFCALLAATQNLGKTEEDAPDLLPAVQEKIYRRTKGRYFRERFGRRANRSTILPIIVVTVALVVIVAWLMLTYVQLEVPTDEVPESSGEVRSDP